MGYSFDPSEYDDGDEEELEAHAAAVVSELEEDELELDDTDELLEDVEKRLEVASCYQILLKDRLFNQPTEASAVVEKRIRSFVRQELRALFGLHQPQPEKADLFTDEEVAALKVVAKKLIGKPSLAEPRAPSLAPKASVKPAPSLNAATNSPTSPPKKPSRPKAKKTAPVAAVPAPKNGVIREIPQEDGGRVEVKSVNGRIVRERYDAGGRLIESRDGSPQVVSPQAAPMPSGDEMTAITHSQAMVSVTSATSNPNTASLLGHLGALSGAGE